MYELTPDGRELVSLYALTPPHVAPRMPAYARLSVDGQTFSAACVRTGQPVITSDLDAAAIHLSETVPLVRAIGASAVAAFPLRSEGQIIGSLAFLRPLCTSPDAAEWPKRMQALMEAEGTSPGRRERLAGAYNRGYQAFGLTYRVCTPSAQEAALRYLKEGDQLTRTVAGRYGG